MSDPLKGLIAKLPRDVSQFTMVDTIYFDQVSQKWLFEDPETGIELLFDNNSRTWVRPAEQRSPLAENDEHHQNTDEAIPGVKRKADDESQETAEDEEKRTVKELRLKKKQKIRDIKEQEKHARQKARQGTAVYVSNIPKDVTKEELESVFEKYGILAEDLNSGEKRVKIYKDAETGEPKGDALIVYYRSESVALAIDMLDDTKIRQDDDDTAKLRVQKANFEKYGNNNNNNSNNNGNGNSTSPSKNKTENQGDAEEYKKRKQKLNKRLNDMINNWEETDQLRHEKRQKYLKRYEKTVVLQHCFTLDEIAEDPEVVEDIEQDMFDECSKFGQIVKVIVYDEEPEGIVLVKFADKSAADLCVLKLGGRFFGGQQLNAFIYDGKPYKKSKKNNEQDANSEQRLKEYEEFLKSTD